MYYLLVFILLIPSFCLAEEKLEVLLPMPDMPLSIEDGEKMEPNIIIIRKGDEIIQEFRRNGALYMIKIVPDIGPAYYLIDTNGDGNMDVQKSDLDRDFDINQWKILEWD